MFYCSFLPALLRIIFTALEEPVEREKQDMLLHCLHPRTLRSASSSYICPNIPSYFSGCLTLTLQRNYEIPRQDYILCVDVEPHVVDKIKQLTGKNKDEYEVVAKHMIDEADVDLFRELVSKDDYLRKHQIIKNIYRLSRI